ncbi:MAG: tRNA pseudouridine(38-40) synthase TruA [Bacteroidia bacterium]
MPRYFLHLAYNGKHYHGWQFQLNTPLTIQQILQEKLSLLLHEKITLIGCGRTDTGVHAKEYYAHFDCGKEDLLSDKQNWLFKMNHCVPKYIALIDILPVQNNANARFSATARTYKYYIHQTPNPFVNDFSAYIYGAMDVDLMNEAAQIIKNTKDFTSFTKVNNNHTNYICDIMECNWLKENSHIIFTIKANRFLRNMVRALVGTMLEVGMKKITIEDFEKVVLSKNRSEAGASITGKGLHLVSIDYPSSIFI